jgi:hypothetical protein
MPLWPSPLVRLSLRSDPGGLHGKVDLRRSRRIRRDEAAAVCEVLKPAQKAWDDCRKAAEERRNAARAQVAYLRRFLI